MGLSLLGLMACGQKTESTEGNAGSTGQETVKAEENAKTENSEGSKDKVTLSVSIWDTNQEPGLKEIMDDFTKETGIETKISVGRIIGRLWKLPHREELYRMFSGCIPMSLSVI